MDCRDVAAVEEKGEFDEARMLLTLVLEDEEGDETKVQVPARYQVCRVCSGKGKVVNPSIDRQGLSREDFDEAGADFEEDYHSGVYDITCPGCDGKRVVPVVDEERCDPEFVTKWRVQAEARHQAAVEMIHEQEMGY